VKQIISLLILVLALVSCTPSKDTVPQIVESDWDKHCLLEAIDDALLQADVYKCEFDEVECWIMRGDRESSMSCSWTNDITELTL
jgi:hypothetical protein